MYQAFRRHHLRGSSQALQRLHELLYAYGNASAIGIINKRRRWDFPGSFHFVGTIVSTIGERTFSLLLLSAYISLRRQLAPMPSGYAKNGVGSRSSYWGGSDARE